ncbi:ecdysteroid-regulated 16 kDa protein-like [Planococcus citri]|uniref:ecdysteroid-regulated 16 kDa protein-like n=1 Tax=Planococcus citri TaxID=170843 RepID=UPI0031F7E5A1
MLTYTHPICSSLPCRFKKGTNVTVEFTFKPTSDHVELYHVVYLNITDIRQNFSGLHNTIACPFIHPVNKPQDNGCPLKAGEEYLYHLQIHIEDTFPRIDFFMLHWSFRDRAKEIDAICVELPAKIIA